MQQLTADAVRVIAHLSVSAMEDWLTCPLRWAGRRVFGWTETPTVDLAMGSALHHALERHHQGQDGGLALLTAWKDVQPLQPPRGALERSLDALGAYCRTNPAEPGDRSEISFAVEVPGVPVPLVGIFDGLRGSDILEFKTGRTRWTQERVDGTLQGTAYWWAYQQLYGTPPSALRYVSLCTGGPRAGQVTTLVTTRTEPQLTEFVQNGQATYQAMTTQPLEARCPAGRCRFPDRCPRAAAEPTQLQELEAAISEYDALGQVIDQLAATGQGARGPELIAGPYKRARDRALAVEDQWLVGE